MKMVCWNARSLSSGDSKSATASRNHTQLASGVSGSRAGSLQALIAAVQDELTGTKRVTVHNFSTSAVDIGTATMWDVLIITRTTETPDFATLVDQLLKKVTV